MSQINHKKGEYDCQVNDGEGNSEANKYIANLCGVIKEDHEQLKNLTQIKMLDTHCLYQSAYQQYEPHTSSAIKL